jgi:hypothetical protein
MCQYLNSTYFALRPYMGRQFFYKSLWHKIGRIPSDSHGNRTDQQQLAWDYFNEQARSDQENGGQLLAYVVMDTHYHALLGCIEKTDLSEQTSAHGSVTQVDYFPVCGLRPAMQVIRYIYRNPIEAKLCTKIQEYPWSSLFVMMGLIDGPSVRDPLYFIVNPIVVLNWINQDQENLDLPRAKF